MTAFLDLSRVRDAEIWSEFHLTVGSVEMANSEYLECCNRHGIDPVRTRASATKIHFIDDAHLTAFLMKYSQ